jgi:HK97 family phage prohead protease/HK97 family phage major capsid protein
MLKDKVLRLNSAFTIKQDALPQTGNSTIESIFIEGYASTVDIDRQGDVVPKSVWEAGIQNYLKNPIILAQHDYDDPIGRMVDYKIDDKGLWVKARISSAAEECYGLIKDKVLTAFSIGFKVLDAEYNSAAEVFLIKELELVEISVVSVPCNQNTVFDLSKAFSDANEYTEFKQQFTPNGNSAKGLESTTEVNGTSQGKWKMDPKELEQMVAQAAKSAAEQATKSLVAAQEAAAQEKAAAEKAAQEFDAKVKAAVQIQIGDSGAERLLAEMTKRLDEQTASSKSALEGLEASIKEKAAELAAIQKSKMSFNDKQTGEAVSYQDREKAVLLAKVAGKSIEDTKFGRDLIAKAGTYNVSTPLSATTGAIGTTGAHLPSGIWELEVSTNMEAEVRRRLVVAPLFRAISMNTNVMTMPLNPEAGLATWVGNDQFGTANSRGGSTATTGQTPGSGSPHKLKEVTLNAYKVASNEYLAYEEEEDSILVILPIVRDAMVRRIARTVDRAYLLGDAGTIAPFNGLNAYASSAATPSAAAATYGSVAALRNMRKGLGAWGLDPAEVVFVVSTEVYYDLLDDSTFQDMSKVGPLATQLTGQIGQVGGSPVLVSAEFDTKGSGKTGAIAFAPGNFLAGNQRGLRFDTQELVETQRRVLVASLRTGMTQVTANLGSGATKLVWAA